MLSMFESIIFRLVTTYEERQQFYKICARNTLSTKATSAQSKSEGEEVIIVSDDKIDIIESDIQKPELIDKTKVIDVQQTPEDKVQKITEETQKITEETQQITEETQKITEETQKITEETQKITEETQEITNEVTEDEEVKVDNSEPSEETKKRFSEQAAMLGQMLEDISNTAASNRAVNKKGIDNPQDETLQEIAATTVVATKTGAVNFYKELGQEQTRTPVFKGFKWLLRDADADEFSSIVFSIQCLRNTKNHLEAMRQFVLGLDSVEDLTDTELNDMKTHCTKVIRYVENYEGQCIQKDTLKELRSIQEAVIEARTLVRRLNDLKSKGTLHKTEQQTLKDTESQLLVTFEKLKN